MLPTLLHAARRALPNYCQLSLMRALEARQPPRFLGTMRTPTGSTA